ncbi:YwdI family protein [Pontibacillus salicampi]|uniref:YwdI family protein n=1 Tax=Pontibacillus salicampi TaxID=1449801 RepID=A0ABV6LRY1_9BACI
MSVSYEQILQKMMKEIQEAHLQVNDPEKVKEHVRAVKLLGDLIDDTSSTSRVAAQQVAPNQTYRGHSQPTPQAAPSKETTPTPAPASEPSIDHEEANGESLFDF